MRHFIATVSPDALGNWEICKREGLWGVIQKGGSGTGAANARRVAAGDQVFVWLGKPKRGNGASGVIAAIEALGPYESATPSVTVPWPNRSDYAGVFPIRVVAELDTPEGDTFPAPARVGRRFGLSNMALIHGFREIDRTVAEKLDALFPATPTLAIGTRYLLRPPPAPTAGALPFAVDPDLVDRALAAHHSTVDRLARWVASRGFDPRLPTATEPQYDLARFEGDVLNVAEVKSVTKENEEQQLRLGLGQVLRYRELLGSRPCPLEWCNS